MKFSIEKIWNVLFPPACIRCGSEGTWLCSFCQRLLPNALVRWCPACCRSVSAEHSLRRHGLYFDECWSLVSYHEPWVERAVHDIKFGGTAKFADVLGQELAERLGISTRAAAGSPTRSGMEQSSSIITAIPLSKKRQRERGFNQAEHIARSLCDHSGIPYEHLLERKKVTKAQAKLSAEERQANVADAFQISPPPRNRGIPIPRNLEPSGKTFVLVDDVVTTGATLSEAARILKVSGAGRVITLTVAYAVLEKVQNEQAWPLTSK